MQRERERYQSYLEDNPPRELWYCEGCGITHKEDHEARSCCGDDYSQVWECPRCEEVHFDEDEAYLCCEPDEADRDCYLYHSKR